MAEGYIKLYRSLIDWEWYDDINVCRLWTHLLLTTNFKPGKWHGIEYESGQRIVSISGLADETGLSFKQVRTALDKLKSTKEVSTNRAYHGANGMSVVTIENWDKFQSCDSEAACERADKGQAWGKLRATEEERKKERIYREDTNVSSLSEQKIPTPKTLKSFPHDSEPYKVAVYLDKKICERLPDRKRSDESRLQAWAREFERTNRIDGKNWDAIAEVLVFSQKDKFWQNNILSAKKFREKYDQLCLKMKSEG